MSLVSQLFRFASVGQVKPVALDESTLTVLELDYVEAPIVTSKQIPLDDGQVTVHDLYPGEADVEPIAVTVVPIAEPATAQPSAVHAAAFDLARHVFSTHVDNVPAAGAFESVYPALQAEQSTAV